METRDFFEAGGTLAPDSPSYIVREADEELLGLTLSGEYCNVLTSRQMGKSSLIVRAQRRLKDAGVYSAVIDLTEIGTQDVSAEAWYYSLISEIGRKLNLGKDQADWWTSRHMLSPVQRFTEFLQQVVLQRLPGKIVLFVDEIDSTLSLDFTDDFFLAIRAMHNDRANNPNQRRLTFVLVGVARPTDLIKNPEPKPYNIGQTVDLKDFSTQNARKLLPGLDGISPRPAEQILSRVLYWTGGHPFLTQRVCAEIVQQEGDWSDTRIDQLVERLFFRQGQIRRETNLQWIERYVHESPHREQMLSVYHDLLAGKQVEDDESSLIKSGLKLSGLVKATPAGDLVLRNRIYEGVFDSKWAGVDRPFVWPGLLLDKRWRRPVRWAIGLLATAALVVAVQAIVGRGQVSAPTPTVVMETPTLTLISTNTRSVTTETPTREPTHTSVPSGESATAPTSTVTRTNTPIPRATATLLPTPTLQSPTPTLEPTPFVTTLGEPVNLRTGPAKVYDVVVRARQGDTFPLVARTGDSDWLGVDYGGQVLWVAGYVVQASHDLEPIPTLGVLPPTPTATPTPPLLAAPVLMEPERGAVYGQGQIMRIKLIWLRRLQSSERFAISVVSVQNPSQSDGWLPNEGDILKGGGASYETAQGYLYEINYGLDSSDLPFGEATWKVAVFRDLGPDSKQQISNWSVKRLVVKKGP